MSVVSLKDFLICENSYPTYIYLHLIKSLRCHIRYTNIRVLILRPTLFLTPGVAIQNYWPNLSRGTTRTSITAMQLQRLYTQRGWRQMNETLIQIEHCWNDTGNQKCLKKSPSQSHETDLRSFRSTAGMALQHVGVFHKIKHFNS